MFLCDVDFCDVEVAVEGCGLEDLEEFFGGGSVNEFVGDDEGSFAVVAAVEGDDDVSYDGHAAPALLTTAS